MPAQKKPRKPAPPQPPRRPKPRRPAPARRIPTLPWGVRWDGVLVLLLTLLLYVRTVGFEYTYLDDKLLVQDRAEWLADWKNLPEAFTQSFFGDNYPQADLYYRPLQTVMIFVGYHLAGDDSLWSHKLIALLLHMLAAGMLWRGLCLVGVARLAAMGGALFWAMHPMLVNTVAFFPALSDVMVSVFALGSLFVLRRYLLSPHTKWLLLLLLLFALALFSKESAILLPVLWVAIWVLTRGWSALRTYWRSYALLSVALVAVALCWAMLRNAAVTERPEEGLLVAIYNVFASLGGLVLYMGGLLTPYKPMPMVVPGLLHIVAGLLGLAILLAGYARARGTARRFIVLGVLGFALFMAPTFVLGAEAGDLRYLASRMYLPGTGLVLALVVSLAALIPTGQMSRVVLLGMTALLGTAAYGAWQTQENYRDRISLWESAVRHFPDNTRARAELLSLQLQIGQAPPNVWARYQRLVDESSETHRLHYNVGVYLYNQQDERAFQAFQRQLEVTPDHHESMNYMGMYMLLAHQDTSGALAIWRRVLHTHPTYTPARNNLIQFFKETQQPDSVAFYQNRTE